MKDLWFGVLICNMDECWMTTQSGLRHTSSGHPYTGFNLQVTAPFWAHTDIDVAQLVLFPLHQFVPPYRFLSVSCTFTRVRVVRVTGPSSMAKYNPETRVGVVVLHVLSYWHLQWLFVLPKLNLVSLLIGCVFVCSVCVCLPLGRALFQSVGHKNQRWLGGSCMWKVGVVLL